ncbi:two pore domain potassium channel family protein [Mycoplasmopsis anatis]
MNILHNKMMHIINTIVTSDSEVNKLKLGKKRTHLIKFAQLFILL